MEEQSLTNLHVWQRDLATLVNFGIAAFLGGRFKGF
jgi:hypothetical protein